MEQIQMVQIELLRPHEQNPRIDAASVAELVESIRVHGIEVPLVAAPVKDVDGSSFVVLAGHRRLTAAHELGLAEVPVQIRGDLTEARDQLAFMATENILRDQLTAMEESRLVQDMLDLGMTQAEVAKQTALGKQRVSDRVKLAKLAEGAGEKVHRGQITVDDALVIAQFSDDEDDARALEAAAGTVNFDYAVARIRSGREAERERKAAAKELKKLGVRVVDDAQVDFCSLEDLASDGRWTSSELTAIAGLEDDEWLAALPKAHASCPGQSATIAWSGNVHFGCDQADVQHPESSDATAEVTDEPAEPAPLPLAHITAEDLAAARMYRETAIAEALPCLDVEAEARELLVDLLVKTIDGTQEPRAYDKEIGASWLRILGADTVEQARRRLEKLPTATLAWLTLTQSRESVRSSACRADWGAEPRLYQRWWWEWDGKGYHHLDSLMSRIGITPAAAELEVFEHVNGRPWGAPVDEATEGGDAA